MKTTTIRYDESLDREVEEQAKKEDRSKNKLIIKALREYLKRAALKEG